MPIHMLSSRQQRRVERLARRAGRTPRAMMKYVLRDGFGVCEQDVRENLAADAEFAAGKSVAHTDSMTRARASLQRTRAGASR